MSSGRPILVTGSHRSGTTWCGRVLASQPGVFYVHEPFSIIHAPGTCSVEFTRWYQYVNEEAEKKYRDALRQTVQLKFSFVSQVKAALRREEQFGSTGVRGVGWAVREWGKWAWARWRGARPLLKDPIALFSAEYIAGRFDAQVIVMVRHPAAFTYSLQRAGWTHDFSNFTDQPALLNGDLAPFADEIRRAAEDPGDIVDQAILLWKAMNDVVDTYRQRHPSWKIVRNEDLGARPVEHYERLCDYLKLPFDARMKQTIREFTGAEDRQAEEMPLHAVRRDSQSEIWRWRREMDEAVIRRVREGTTPIWQRFYDESEW